MSRRTAYALVALAAAVPRLAIVFYEHNALFASAEKSDIWAQTFVQSGTYGFIPGEPSAYTQPLYGWFLIPIYWIFGRSAIAVGVTQTLVAVAVALLVFEIARRVVSSRWAVVAAVISTLHPYIVWHDVHVNREIIDQLCAAGLVLLTLLVAERPTWPRSVLLGIVTGLAMLGNARLVFIPLLCVAYLLFRLPRTRATALTCALVLAGAGVAVAPWLVRNKVELGCWAITTDGRALWKANNPQTYHLLASGGWIDDVAAGSPRPPSPAHLTPDEAHGIWVRTNGRNRPHPNECLAMTFYEHLAETWVAHHPGAKLRLVGLSEQLFWQPNVIETGGSSSGLMKQVVEPAYMIVLYVLAAFGLLVVRRSFAALALSLFAYESVFVAVFVGATRYRIAFDFLIAVLAVGALAHARRLRPARA